MSSIFQTSDVPLAVAVFSANQQTKRSNMWN